MAVEHPSKIPLAVTPDFTISVELFRDKIWAHADVHKWNKRTKTQFILALDMIQDLKLKRDLYTTSVPEGTKKRQKFIRLVGFILVGEEDFQGLTLPVYRRMYHG